MFKNLSLRTMSLLGALAITLFAGLGIWIGQKTLYIPVNGTYAIIMVIAVGLVAYLAIQFILCLLYTSRCV